MSFGPDKTAAVLDGLLDGALSNSCGWHSEQCLQTVIGGDVPEAMFFMQWPPRA